MFTDAQARRGQDRLTMDAATRAELAALRRRAYRRDADIAGDSVALERLAELEELALPAPPEDAPAPVSTARAPQPEAAASDPITHSGPAAHRPRRGRPSPRRLLVIGLASAAVLVAVLSTVRALQTVPDPILAGEATAPSTPSRAATGIAATGPVTIPLLIDSVRGEFIDVSSRPDAPMFLANGVTTWAQPLGVYYGWALWVAGVSSGQGLENCLLLTDGSATEAQCIPHDDTAEGALGVSLAYDKLAEHQRPLDMTPDQRVTFGWGGGAYMTMEITDNR